MTVYARDGSSVLRTISDGIGEPVALAFGRAGGLYVANAPYRYPGTVTAYGRGQKKLLWTIKQDIDQPSALAVDRSGKLYVANYASSTVTVYAPGGKELRAIFQGIDHPLTLALDSSGYLYVGNCNANCFRFGGGTVTVYPPGQSALLRTISQGVDQPVKLIVGGLGYLYVANYASDTYYSTVTAYAPGEVTVQRTISGLAGAEALALAPNGNLFVGNCYHLCAYGSDTGFVAAFAAGKTKLLRSIVQGVAYPSAVAVSNSGDLFVANENASTVTAYVPGRTVPRTITQGVGQPDALAFGP